MTRRNGFSLLEILVAFSILAMSLGILMRILSGSLNNADVANDRFHATLIAHSLMAGAGSDYPLAPGEQRSSQGEKYRWTIRIAPYESDDGTPLAQTIPPATLWRITAQVEWSTPGALKGHALRLTSLRIAPTAAP